MKNESCCLVLLAWLTTLTVSLLLVYGIRKVNIKERLKYH